MVTCDGIIGHDCDCPAFAKFSECKHRLAIRDAVSDAQAAHDAQEGEREWFANRPFDVAEYEFRNFCEGIN